nr:hypothetical protein [Microseira wollei]
MTDQVLLTLVYLHHLPTFQMRLCSIWNK